MAFKKSVCLLRFAQRENFLDELKKFFKVRLESFTDDSDVFLKYLKKQLRENVLDEDYIKETIFNYLLSLEKNLFQLSSKISEIGQRYHDPKLFDEEPTPISDRQMKYKKKRRQFKAYLNC